MKQHSNLTISSVSTASKKAVSNLVMFLVILLMILPFVTTFDEFLTRVAQSTYFFEVIQKVLVPFEVGLVRTILAFWGIQTLEGTVSIIKNGQASGSWISWNCIGWQSFVILLISLKAGLGQEFTRFSKVEVLVMGIVGTFLLNIFRISLILILLYFWGSGPSGFFHKYGSMILSAAWIIFFWWFSYTFVLEEKA